jgi:hypothetical protein
MMHRQIDSRVRTLAPHYKPCYRGGKSLSNYGLFGAAFTLWLWALY